MDPDDLDHGRPYEGLSSADLKAVIMDAHFAGIFTRQEAEDLLHEYGLVHA